MPAKWYSQQPTNRNFLAPSGFKLDLDIFPGVDFFCQKANVPDISVGSTEVSTRYRGVPIASSGGVTFGDLDLSFIVDEDMKNYLTIWKWIYQNNLAEDFDDQKYPDYSQARLQILNSNFNPNIIVVFENIFPTELTELSFDVEDQDVEYLTATSRFKFTKYYFTNADNQRI